MPASDLSRDARVYRAALRALPARFQHDFAGDMASDFDDGRAEALASAERRAVWAFRARMARDLVRALAVQWLRTGWLLIAFLATAATFVVVSAVARLVSHAVVVLPSGTADNEVIALEMLAVIVLVFIVMAVLLTMWSARVVTRASRRRT